MMRLLYPLIASALITIVPFLLTFESGQDIVRGLFGYEYFALLLLITYIKNKLTKSGLRTKRIYTAILVILVTILYYTAWIDLQNLLAIKNRETSWYGLLPFITCTIAILMVFKQKAFSFNAICLILFVSLIVHLFAFNYYAAQPLAQFTTIDYLERNISEPVNRKEISNEYRNRFIVTDSVTITRNFVDTTRNNVIILVESWGVPLEQYRFEKQIDIFNGITKVVGIHNRMYSRTRTAEREDLMLKFVMDSTRRRDTTFLPKVFADMGYRTTFLFGGDSLEHWRDKYIPSLGFNEAIYGHGQDDATMVQEINRILADTTQKHFIAWTTRNTKFPMEDFPDIYNSNADALDSAYSHNLRQTLTLIANLAKKHPNAKFIVQGDHNPILSTTTFQEKFYRRLVPYTILN